MKKLTPAQQRALDQLTADTWKSPVDLNTKPRVLDSLVRIRLAESRPKPYTVTIQKHCVPCVFEYRRR